MGRDTETPFGPGVAKGWWEQAVPTWSVPRSLPALGPASQKAVPAASKGGDSNLLEQLLGASARRAAEDGHS